jgi:hypothetical protein
MYWLISRNHPYLEELQKNSINTAYRREFEAMEIDLKNKFTAVQDFDIEDCFNLDQNSPENSISYDEDDINDNARIGRDDSGIKRTPTNKTFMTNNGVQIQGSRRNIVEKIMSYKTYIKIFDVLSAIFIIFGAIIAQYEHELYYYGNIHRRVSAVIIINYINNNPGNNTWDKIFSDKNVNLTQLTELDKIDPEVTFVSIVKDINGSMTNNNKLVYPSAINNDDILTAMVDKTQFGYSSNMNDTSDIIIPLEIDDTGRTLRLVILFSSILAALLLFFSRYLEHLRENVYKKEQEFPFYKSDSCLYLFFEYVLILFFQFPGINSSIIFTQLGNTMCLPFTSILASISIFRFIFIYKIFKSFTIWNSYLAEVKCEKHVCSADTKFAFKALQKEHPFLTLFIIFVLTCVCFGFSLRNFEMHYWETQKELNQNWRYHWNAMWCVFVSMTTVGYGDFYPKTHLGRFIVIIACIVGIYFVSMMMVFMTEKSILNESEQKAYKLITRLKLRKEITDIQSHIVCHSIKMALLRKQKANREIDDKEFDIKYNYQKRCIIKWIDEKKIKDRNIKMFNIIPTKEQLFDICERIHTDIREIKREIESMKLINNSIIGFAESQKNMIMYFQKNVVSTKLLYDLIEKKPQVFGDLGKFDKSVLKDEFGSENLSSKAFAKLMKEKFEIKPPAEIKYSNKNLQLISSESPDNLIRSEYKKKSMSTNQIVHNEKNVLNIPHLDLNEVSGNENPGRRRTNPNQFDDHIANINKNPNERREESDGEYDNENYAEELSRYNVTPEEFKSHFSVLFFYNSEMSKKTVKNVTSRTLNTIKSMKDDNKKLQSMRMMKNYRSPRKKPLSVANSNKSGNNSLKQ